MSNSRQKDFYSKGHLITSAIRVLEHQNSAPPSIKDVCGLLSFSIEQGHLLCKKLDQLGVIEQVEGNFGIRLFIKDHLLLEEIPKQEPSSTIQDEVEKFKSSNKNFKEKIETFQTRKEEEKKALFADIEAKFKQQTQKK